MAAGPVFTLPGGPAELALAVAVPANTPVRWRAAFAGGLAEAAMGVAVTVTPGLGRLTPPLSSFQLRLAGRTYAFSSLRHWRSTRTTWGTGHWQFAAEHDGVRIEGELTAPDPAQVALVAYTDTDASALWCANSKRAALTLHVHDTRTGARQTLRSSQHAAFEEVDRRPPQRAVTL